MIRNLILITIAGFVTSGICFAAAFSFAGPDLLTHDWVDSKRTVAYSESSEVGDEGAVRGLATREMTWAGESLEIDVPAEVRFIQAPGEARMVVTGPGALLDELRLDGGRLTGLDREGRRRISIEITAPKITEFELAGESTLIIENYDQPHLTLDVAGRADVAGRGRTQAMTLNIHGSSDTDLSELTAEDVVANVRSNGEATIAARGQADLTVSGQGKVILSVRPARLNSDVTGQGKVVQAGGGAEATAPPPAPAKDATS